MTDNANSDVSRAGAEETCAKLGFEKVGEFPVEGLKEAWLQSEGGGEFTVVHYARKDGLFLAVTYHDQDLYNSEITCHISYKKSSSMQSGYASQLLLNICDNYSSQRANLSDGQAHSLAGGDVHTFVLKCSLEALNFSKLEAIIKELENNGRFLPITPTNYYGKYLGITKVDWEALDYPFSVSLLDEPQTQGVDDLVNMRQGAYPQWAQQLII